MYGIQESIQVTETCKEIFLGATLQEWQDCNRKGPHQLRELFASLELDADDPAWITRGNEALLNRQLHELSAKLEAVDGDLGLLLSTASPSQ